MQSLDHLQLLPVLCKLIIVIRERNHVIRDQSGAAFSADRTEPLQFCNQRCALLISPENFAFLFAWIHRTSKSLSEDDPFPSAAIT
jgi:hypothetical protein